MTVAAVMMEMVMIVMTLRLLMMIARLKIKLARSVKSSFRSVVLERGAGSWGRAVVSR